MPLGDSSGLPQMAIAHVSISAIPVARADYETAVIASEFHVRKIQCCFKLSKHFQKSFSCKLFRKGVVTFSISSTFSKCYSLR
jgi:hypothetical protein